MEYVEPIKEIEQINTMKDILSSHSKRDLLFFVLGINTGIKISDLLSLKVEDVWDKEEMKEFLYLTDKKTGEKKAYYLNSSVNTTLESYLSSITFQKNDYLFKSQKNNMPITRQQAYRIINHAAQEAGIEGNIGTHTLRKTFGYHAYRKGISISIIMGIYQHHSPAETLHYIGIDRHEEHIVKIDVNL
ncbi:tyrosine-type recombinase/integrase [Bacillus benzoevorans]|uniref:Site-specific recombinase XerD n=1 Tax=Bacillus benzoevorans TaxID=1456 RepID=A0A7X0HPK8_9BACI|nr:tyrosine-type recombinase/integrase [Bacillus benzoevorans]MBB6444637.1 site-specific recombinase XerD [Bacillus benzoevorans]